MTLVLWFRDFRELTAFGSPAYHLGHKVGQATQRTANAHLWVLMCWFKHLSPQNQRLQQRRASSLRTSPAHTEHLIVKLILTSGK